MRFGGASILWPPVFLLRFYFALFQCDPESSASPVVDFEIENASPGRLQRCRLVDRLMLRPLKPCSRSDHLARPNARKLPRNPGAGVLGYRVAPLVLDRVRSFSWHSSIQGFEFCFNSFFLPLLTCVQDLSCHLLELVVFEDCLPSYQSLSFFINHHATSYRRKADRIEPGAA